MENNNKQNNRQPVADGQGQRQVKRKKNWRRVWKTALAVVVAAVALGAGISIYDAMRWYDYECVSGNVEVQMRDWPEEYRVYNMKTGQITIRHITDYDYNENIPLVKFWGGRDGKSVGYFDCATGKPVIVPEYKRGWKVSDGIVTVMDHDRNLHFFKTDGTPLHSKTFRYISAMNNVKYHSGHCAMSDTTGLWGLIDTAGNWSIEPKYTLAKAETQGFDEEWLGVWRLNGPGGESIADSNANIILTTGHGSEIIVNSEGTIVVTHKNIPSAVYDLTGKLLYRKAYYTVSQLFSDTDGDDEYSSSQTRIKANALMFMLWDGRCGLMDLKGHPLTEAIYSSIRVIGENLFSAAIYGSDAEVLLDAQGRIVE